MNVTFDNAEYFDVKFGQNADFEVDFGSVVPINPYEGSYRVIPSAEQQVLPTANKQLEANVVVEAVPTYEGTYEVTPRIYSQELSTEGKLMNDDVTVYEIPITRVTNPHGGVTVLIG